jgi:hypothetical protein
LCWAAGLLWPGPVVVGELDPAGGDLAGRLPLERAGGLAALAAAARHTVSWEQLAERLQPATQTCAALLGPPDAVLARGAVGVLAGGLPSAAASAGVAGLWDLGRLDPMSPAWAAAEVCDLVTVMVRPTAGDVSHAVPLLDQLIRRRCRAAVVIAAPRQRRGAHVDDVVIDAIAERVSGPVVMLGRVVFDPAGVSMAERIMSRWAGKCALGASVRQVIAAVAAAGTRPGTEVVPGAGSAGIGVDDPSQEVSTAPRSQNGRRT